MAEVRKKDKDKELDKRRKFVEGFSRSLGLKTFIRGIFSSGSTKK